jgi:hypothetical protein
MKLFVFALMFTLLTIIQNNDPVMATEGGEVGFFAVAFWLILLNEHKQQLTQWFNQQKSRFMLSHRGEHHV